MTRPTVQKQPTTNPASHREYGRGPGHCERAVEDGQDNLPTDWTCLLCKSSSRTMCCRCPSGAGRTLQAVPQTGSRRRGKRRRRRTRGTGGGGGGGGGGGERRKRGSFRQTQRTKSGRLRRCRPGASPILCPAPDADFTPVASDNTKALLREVGNHRDFGQFLHADFHWTAPCTSLANPHCVRYTFDVDGVMIQLRHTRGMVAEIYLNLSRVVATLQPRRRGGT
ncbi:uncharacterized protein LOC116684010 [Etheostoma spectabile]|uniref:uncharacterized protein LOC116676927 n=1 Tax=Etheostoma spectabile TaxID=54343 RepID=UPI0013AFC33E|nr:uncharacterized protein LOC116676927 [Etheostoma spectabile]XP_032365922.1 uncharacterized protein LOC116684010 [Etheostoma spectabile]